MTNSKIDDSMLGLVSKPNTEMKVWDNIRRNMTSWNKFVAMQKIMADEIGVTRQYIGKVLHKLEAKNYIVKNGKQQINVVFMVNPEYHWVGNKDDIKKGMAKYKSIKELIDE